MKATILVDSTRAGNLKAEWGLCILVEYNKKNILIDTGASNNFLKNAQMCCIDISNVDVGVLSHAHYDHANGFGAFFAVNNHAKFYLLKACKENCYSSRRFYNKYIGIKKGSLQKYKNRLVFIDKTHTLMKGVTLVSNEPQNAKIIQSEKLKATGHTKGTLLVKNGKNWHYDTFDHEQIIVFETEKGLIVFTTCAHKGVINTVQEVKNSFPDKKIYALVGGFHLHRKSENEVAKIGIALAKTEIQQIYTGHCTGEQSFEILKKYLHQRLFHLHTGLIMKF